MTHQPFERFAHALFDEAARRMTRSRPISCAGIPLPLPVAPTDFIDGLVPMAGNGSPDAQAGCAIYLFAANRSMRRRFFYDADGEMLIVPQLGALTLDTELGRVHVEPQEIAVIPRGLRFRVELPDRARRAATSARISAHHSSCPILDPLAPMDLPTPRDFLTPRARYEDVEQPTAI